MSFDALALSRPLALAAASPCRKSKVDQWNGDTG